MTDQSAAEVLNDLIQVNAERISRYEKLLENIQSDQKSIRILFAKIIGESYHNKIMLAEELLAMGELIDLAPSRRGLVYHHAISRMEGAATSEFRILDEADATEDAAIAAYFISLNAEDVAAYLKDLLTKHHHKITECKDVIRQLRDGTDFL